ncbi:MAG: hypothetical protein M4579_003340 [Chaenotheca gracillima]|nr:MAG: hypothetical protein M4579_003340 [Chaenotheca gracillima]
MAISSFAQTVWQLVLSQGIMYGVGGILLYIPGIFYLDEWFIRRKGFAYGLMWAGTGTGGVLVPLVLNLALDRFGLRTVLRAWAVLFAVIAVPLIAILKPRLPLPRHSGPRPIDSSFLRSPTFWILLGGNIFESFGYFVPAIYIPSYARALGLNALTGSIMVSLINFASSIGAITVGILVDRLQVTTVILISSLGTAAAVFLCWGLAVSLPALCVFTLLYGLFAGGYSVTWSACVKDVQSDIRDQGREGDSGGSADLGIVMGLMAAGRGVGSVCSGPLSELLLSSMPWQGEAAKGYGTGYGALIVFTGASALLGGMSCVSRVPKMLKSD